ncbi:MAG: reductase [Actinomycetota bacterium]|nr:reductase [Actinomycetota bacterium]
MRVLVLGGTLFLSHATAAEAVARGHEVTCAARGESGPVPDGATLVQLDREDPHWDALADQSWDVVVDVGRRPSWVRAAVEALGARTGSWVFVSTCSVYADHATPGGTTDDALLPAAGAGVDESDMAHYGELKVACEQAVVQRLGEQALVVRPGLVVGPGDPSGRFAYWPHRMSESATVVAPGEPDDAVQVVDVRDLASWLVDAGERGLRGTFDAVGPVTARGTLLAAVAAGIGADPRLVWVPQEFLLAHDVQPWMGARSLPLWLPTPDYAGLMARDASATLAAGLAVRPVEETAMDTLAWLRETPGAPVTGLTTEEHRALLHAWHRVEQVELS